MTDGWQRLDQRMLLVRPVQETRVFLPALIGVAVLGTASGFGWPALVALALPVGIGVVRYLTTRYRIVEGRIELQRGLLQRKRLSTPLDRVRTVDLTASLIHRLFGLSTLVIGTGTVVTDAGDRLVLDALATDEALALRDRLLGGVAARHEAGAAADEDADVVPASRNATAAPVAAFAPRWLWYAPFTSTGLVVAAGLLGASAQILGEYDVRVDISDDDLATPSGALVALTVVAIVLAALTVTVAGYLVTNWRLALTRMPGSWHLRRGLFTTRETSIDVDRLAGVSVGEQAAVRLARGGRLSAIVTGLDRTESGSEVLVPPAPAAVVRSAAAAVLGTPVPVEAPLMSHGRAATGRRFSRALVPAGALAAVAVGLVIAGGSSWLLMVVVAALAIGLALAVDRARSLGHALVAGHLVARSGSLLRRREMLADDHVIGWTFHDTWFQRRAGLTTLIATTAGGRGAVRVLDVPAVDAVGLAHAVTPDLVSQFLAPEPEPEPEPEAAPG